MLCHAFQFFDIAGDRQRRLWACVVRELRIAAALLPFAVVDAKRPFDPLAVASDASGATDFDSGGFGVCERERGSERVRAVAARGGRHLR